MKVKALYFSNKPEINICKEIMIVFILNIVAIILASISIFATNAADDIKSLLLMHISACSEASFMRIFIFLLTEHLLFLIVCFVSGVSVYGKIPIYSLCFFKLTGVASITATLIKIYLLKGLEYCLLIFLPGKILLIFAIVYTSVVGLKTSVSICDYEKSMNIEVYNRQLYMKQFLLSSAILGLSALIDSLTIKMFLPLFDFS